MTTYYTPEQWAELTDERKHEIEKATLFGHLDVAGVEAAARLLTALEEGKLNGQHYWQDNPMGESCGCVLGTLFIDKVEDESDVEDFAKAAVHDHTVFNGYGDDRSPYVRFDIVEKVAWNLEPGDTPENNENAKLLHQWTSEWFEEQGIDG